MATSSKRIAKTGKGKEHTFLGIPRFILNSPEWGQLEPAEVKLLIELAKEYRGKNNGDFSAPWSRMRERGWNSAGTLQAAKDGLLEKGWTLCTRHGGSHRCSLYAVTWWPLDDCDGKSTIFRAEATARHAWRKITPGSPTADQCCPNSERTAPAATK